MQRVRKGRGKLPAEYIEKLEGLGFAWNSYDATWEKAFSAYVDYIEGDPAKPISQGYTTDEGIRLGAWVSNQRTQFKKGKLAHWKVMRLDKVGFKWGALLRYMGNSI